MQHSIGPPAPLAGPPAPLATPSVLYALFIQTNSGKNHIHNPASLERYWLCQQPIRLPVEMGFCLVLC